MNSKKKINNHISNETNSVDETLNEIKQKEDLADIAYPQKILWEALTTLDDDDICYVSDVDEIWNYDLNYKLDDNTVLKPMIKFCYINFLNVRTNEEWTIDSNPFTEPIITKYRNIKDNCLNHLRTLRKTNYTFIENGGWHFNALGGIHKKIEDFQNPIYTINYMNGRELGSRVDENDLPKYLINNRERYKKLFK